MRDLRQQSGFTLIELLVVIAIISLLVSIMMPSLGRAKELARQAVCLCNLRSMAVAAQMYTVECDGSFPIAKYTPANTSEYAFVSWDFRYRRDGTTEAGLLWATGTSRRIQQCPAFTGAANWAGDDYTGYNYNTSYIGHGQFESIFAPARTGDVHNPGQCVLFGDGEYGGGANKYMRAPLSSPGDAGFSMRYAGTQGYRHVGTTNVSFCDGHAVSPAEGYREIEPSYHEINIAAGTGFLSPDNRMYDLE